MHEFNDILKSVFNDDVSTAFREDDDIFLCWK